MLFVESARHPVRKKGQKRTQLKRGTGGLNVLVGYNGKVTYGAGYPVHKAGHDVEPIKPCITRQMTPEERVFYGVKEKGAKKKMGKIRGKRIDFGKLKELISKGSPVAAIAYEMGTEEDVIWKRAKNYGLLTKLKANCGEKVKVVAEIKPPKPKVKQPPAPAYPQDSEENEFRFMSPFWLNEIAKGLTKGDKKHPGATWKQIPATEHAWRAIRHLILFLMGDKTDDHLINAAMRVMMAFEVSRHD